MHDQIESSRPETNHKEVNVEKTKTKRSLRRMQFVAMHSFQVFLMHSQTHLLSDLFVWRVPWVKQS